MCIIFSTIEGNGSNQYLQALTRKTEPLERAFQSLPIPKPVPTVQIFQHFCQSSGVYFNRVGYNGELFPCTLRPILSLDAHARSIKVYSDLPGGESAEYSAKWGTPAGPFSFPECVYLMLSFLQLSWHLPNTVLPG